jgi:hypothetical protein
MTRYLYYSFIINYIHIYLLGPYLIYIGYNSLQNKEKSHLENHYKLLVAIGSLTAIYHMKRLTENSIWIMCLIFIGLAFIEYSYIFSYHIPKIYMKNSITTPNITKSTRSKLNTKIDKKVNKKVNKNGNKKSRFNLYNGS